MAHPVVELVNFACTVDHHHILSHLQRKEEGEFEDAENIARLVQCEEAIRLVR